MRLARIEVEGLLTAFPKPAMLDLERLDSGLIALVGTNGAGKTTLMGAVPLALYRTFPSRPGFYQHFNSKGGVKVSFRDREGTLIECHLGVNAVSRKAESYLRINGKSATETAKASDYRDRVVEMFGSEALFFSSVFASQNKAGNFLQMPRSDRKGLFIEFLGQQHLHILAAMATEQVHEAGIEESTLEAKLVIGKFEPIEYGKLLEQLGELDAGIVEAGKAVVAAKENEKGARSQAEARKELRAKVEALRSTVASKKDQISTSERLVSGGLERIKQINDSFEKQKATISYWTSTDPESKAKERHADEAARIEKARSKVKIDDKVPLETTLMDRAGENKRRLKRAQAAVSEERQMAQKLTILGNQASLMDQAPCTVKETWKTDLGLLVDLRGNCPLLAQARDAKTEMRGIKLKGITALEREVGLSEDSGNAILALQRQAQSNLTARSHLESLDSQKEGADRALKVALKDIADKASSAEHELDQAVKAHAAQSLEANEKHKKESAHLDVYRAELLKSETTLRQVSGGTEISSDEALLLAAIAHREKIEGHVNKLKIEQAEGQTTKAQLEKNRDQYEADKKAIAIVRADLADWKLLAESLGPNGVQALEIDAAGPEVAAITNDLLQSCYGAKFSLRFDTTQQKVSGKGEKEVFDVTVFKDGLPTPVEALSGGEQVIIGEALGLGLSIYNARKSGVKWETIFRDETAGALDPDNAQAYLTMMRRALRVGGFHQMLFVAHDPLVWGAADAVIQIGDGKVEVKGQ